MDVTDGRDRSYPAPKSEIGSRGIFSNTLVGSKGPTLHPIRPTLGRPRGQQKRADTSVAQLYASAPCPGPAESSAWAAGGGLHACARSDHVAPLAVSDSEPRRLVWVRSLKNGLGRSPRTGSLVSLARRIRRSWDGGIKPSAGLRFAINGGGGCCRRRPLLQGHQRPAQIQFQRFYPLGRVRSRAASPTTVSASTPSFCAPLVPPEKKMSHVC